MCVCVCVRAENGMRNETKQYFVGLGCVCVCVRQSDYVCVSIIRRRVHHAQNVLH